MGGRDAQYRARGITPIRAREKWNLSGRNSSGFRDPFYREDTDLATGNIFDVGNDKPTEVSARKIVHALRRIVATHEESKIGVVAMSFGDTMTYAELTTLAREEVPAEAARFGTITEENIFHARGNRQ